MGGPKPLPTTANPPRCDTDFVFGQEPLTVQNLLTNKIFFSVIHDEWITILPSLGDEYENMLNTLLGMRDDTKAANLIIRTLCSPKPDGEPKKFTLRDFADLIKVIPQCTNKISKIYEEFMKKGTFNENIKSPQKSSTHSFCLEGKSEPQKTYYSLSHQPEVIQVSNYEDQMRNNINNNNCTPPSLVLDTKRHFVDHAAIAGSNALISLGDDYWFRAHKLIDKVKYNTNTYKNANRNAGLMFLYDVHNCGVTVDTLFNVLRHVHNPKTDGEDLEERIQAVERTVKTTYW